MKELSDDDVFGAREMSDADLFGPKVHVSLPDHIPEAFLDRFNQEPDTIAAVEKAAGPNLAQRIVGAAIEGGTAGFGEGNLGLSPDTVQRFRKLGIFNDPDRDQLILGGIRFANEAMLRPAFSAIDGFFRGGNALLYGAGAVGGQALAEATGANEAEQARARRDGAHLATTAFLLVTGHPVARYKRTATGEVIPETIGGVPKVEDFATAAEVIGGEKAPKIVQERLLSEYKERGLTPAEIATDAQTDPILAQRLLSSESVELRGTVRLYRGERDWGPYPNELYKPRAEFWSTDLEVARQHGEPRYIEVSRTELAENFVQDTKGHYQAKDGGFQYHGRAQPFDSGGGGKGPPKPPSPPEPPPEGSFEAAQKKVLDKISVGETAPKERLTWDKFYRQAIDDLHPLKAVDEGAYELARLTRGQFGKAEHFIEYGTFDFNTYKTNGKPLKDVLEPVAKDMDGFRAYLASKRAIEIEASGRKSGVDLEAAQRVATEGEGKYGKAAADLQKYQENLLAYLRDSGVISGEAFTAMREAGQNYVPFYRVFEVDKGGPGTKGFGPGSPVHKLKGSERDIVDPLESIIKNTYAFVSVAERNAVGIKLIDTLKKEGEKVTTTKIPRDAELVEYLKENGVTQPEKLADFVNATKADDGTTLSAWRDGVKEQVKVNDPELVAAFRNLDQDSANLLTRVLALPAKGLRAGATLSPDFIVRNIVRDFMTAFVNSGRGLFTPIDTIKGLKSAITKDADFQDWMKGGGANATMVALDRAYMQESLAKLNAETGLGTRSWNVVTSPIRGLRMMSELAENATRLAEFKKTRGEGKEAIQSAAYAAREVTLDFARVGASMRAANMITAFLNAQVQGLDRVGRAFVDRPLNTTAKVAGGITLPSVLLWWANHDDDRYKELPAWQKDLFWIVMTKDHVYRIPKPFELGVVFGSGAERILDATVGQNPEAFDKFGKSIMDILLPNVTPTVAQPLLEQFANRSTMTDRTLIPHEQEKHLPEYQYTPYTTELAKKLGQVVSAFPGMRSTAVGPGAPFGPVARATTSPILLENYIRGWTGGLGMYALNAADLALRKAGVLPDPVTPTPTLADIPVVKAFVVRYPSATTQSIQEFYDQHEVTKKFYDTWLAKAKEGDTEAMERIQAAGGPIMFVRLDAIKETLSQHSKLIRDVYKNPAMKAEEKRQLIDSLYFNMVEMGKAGRGMLTDSKKALEKAPDAAP